ncbi:hypothetical protein [Metabacillus sp. FJAT-52054]|uniref:Uncharacterized protein n=1 Tax=Metabacillus sediminis TaxID=3117746 RepID=A0ABZ2NH40_9BACI
MNFLNQNKYKKPVSPKKKRKKESKDGCLDGCADGCCSFDGCMPLIMIPVQIAFLGHWILDKLI